MQFIKANSVRLLIVINIFLLLTLPQLNNIHYDPLPQFWAEATTAWLSISLFLLLCLSNNRICIPRIAIMLLVFATYIAVQQFAVVINFAGLSYIASYELLVCALLAIAIATAIEIYGLREVMYAICSALVLGSILQTLIGFLQYSGYYKFFGDIIFYDSAHPTTNIFGHFGQRNHYCHYLTWGTFGLVYLYMRHKVKPIIFYSLICWFMFSITIAASRSVFMYFALALIISGLNYVTQRNKDNLTLLIVIISVSLILLLFEYGYPIIQGIVHHGTKINSGLERFTDGGDAGGFGRRIVEWQKAWLTFKSYPIFGFGLNNFAYQSVYLQPLFKHTPANDGLFTNCHNLILQLMAETGIVGTVIVIIGLIWSIRAIIKRNSLETIIILCMMATTFAHSMVEYPLWYLYFLAPLVIFLSFDNTALISIKSNTMAAIATIPIAVIVYLLTSGSIIINTLVNYNDTPIKKAPFVKQVHYLEKLAKNNTIWAYPSVYTLDNYITVNDTNTSAAFTAKEQLKYEIWLTKSHPYPDSLIKIAMLYHNEGDYKLAKQYALAAITAFPVYKSSFLDSLKAKPYQALYEIIKNYK